MAKWDILNVHAHAALAMAAPSARSRHFVQIVASEFDTVAAVFPILFCKSAETGAFYAGAMLGLRPGESLVDDTPDRHAANRLHDVVREGFDIADDAIAVDLDSRRFVEQGPPADARYAASTGRQALFERDEQPTEALRQVQRALSQLHAGLPQTDAFIKRLLARKLIEPIDLSFSFDDGERLTLDGLYTISRDALADLPDAAVLALFRSGDLDLVQAALLSLQHIPRLARRRNDRLVDA